MYGRIGVHSGVYVGRPTKWGNPFVIGRDGDRDQVIQKYRRYLWDHPELIVEAAEKLNGQRLLCHCWPKPCHAQVLVRAIKWFNER